MAATPSVVLNAPAWSIISASLGGILGDSRGDTNGQPHTCVSHRGQRTEQAVDSTHAIPHSLDAHRFVARGAKTNARAASRRLELRRSRSRHRVVLEGLAER